MKVSVSCRLVTPNTKALIGLSPTKLCIGQTCSPDWKVRLNGSKKRRHELHVRTKMEITQIGYSKKQNVWRTRLAHARGLAEPESSPPSRVVNFTTAKKEWEHHLNTSISESLDRTQN